MTDRERTIKTLLYQNPDKIPFAPGAPRKSTIERWRGEGLPESVAWFDYVCDKINVPVPKKAPYPPATVDFRMIPWFEEKILDHMDGHYVIQDWMGAILEIDDKYDYTYIRNAIDFVTRRWIKCPVETLEDWAEMKKRYDPDAPARVAALNPDEAARLDARDDFFSININGPFWQLREWLGF